MKKVLFIFTILVILCTMCISVSAAPMSIIKQPRDQVLALVNGRFNIILTFEVDNAVSYQWYSSYDNVEWVPSRWDSANNSTFTGYVSEAWVSEYPIQYYKCVAMNSDGETITSRVATIEFVRSRFQYFSISALRYVTRWIGYVVSSLTYGALSALLPALAIGISIAALLLVVKIIKLFSWGA